MENFRFNGSHLSRNDVLQLFFRVSVASVITYYSVKWMMNQLDPTSKEKRKAKSRAEKLFKRLNEEGDIKMFPQQFNDYELIIASHLVVPSDITVSWSDIAGLETVIQELRESVVLPIRYRDIFSHSKLWQAPKGVLLHGPPGCGKTLIAKATAKEAGMRFINLDVSILTDKWYGESQKLATAVFSLALKIQPCIIFIDEIDSFLRSRNSSDHEVTAMMKTQFMLLWDGLSTSSKSTVIVMGATNRPQDLDNAILRRMPTQFHIALPGEAQRLSILELILESEEIHGDVDLKQLAKKTVSFSGSDLREMCRNASVYRMRQYMRSHTTSQSGSIEIDGASANNASQLAITMDDLLNSYDKMNQSKLHTRFLYADNRVDMD